MEGIFQGNTVCIVLLLSSALNFDTKADFPSLESSLPGSWRAHIDSWLPLVVDPLKGVVVRLTLVETVLTEVKVSTHLTVVAHSLNGEH